MFYAPPPLMIQGPSGEVWVGQVLTGAPGTPVSFTNTGTPEVAVWDISIPQGAAGANGAPGANGANGAPGAKGDKGDTGTGATVAVGTVTTGAPGSSASVTNVGTSTAAVLNIAIPRGNTGASPTYYATRATTSASGSYTWTYPAALPSIPAISVAVQSATADIFDVKIVSASTTACTVQLGRTQAVTVALLGLTILSVPASVGAQTVHITASV